MNIKYELIFRLKKLVWFITRPKRQGVKCVLESNGKILMIKRTFGTDKFVFPGGAIYVGESPEVAAKREIQEDLGIKLDQIKALGSFEQIVHHRNETLHCFSAQAQSKALSVDQNKIHSICWFDRKNLPELTPVSKSVYKLYQP
jgi:8-oxo-dGTP diphosphatase